MRIGQIIREVAVGKTVSDAADVTAAVFSRIPQDDYAHVLYKLIRAQVTVELGRSRNVEVSRVRGLSEDDFYVPGGSREAEATVDIDFDARPTLIRRDPRATAVFEAFWAQQVPVENGSLKQMAELTAEDCRYIAKVRFEQADLNYKMGQGYSKCAYEMDQAGVTVLRDLDERIVHRALAHPVAEQVG